MDRDLAGAKDLRSGKARLLAKHEAACLTRQCRRPLRGEHTDIKQPIIDGGIRCEPGKAAIPPGVAHDDLARLPLPRRFVHLNLDPYRDT